MQLVLCRQLGGCGCSSPAEPAQRWAMNAAPNPQGNLSSLLHFVSGICDKPDYHQSYWLLGLPPEAQHSYLVQDLSVRTRENCCHEHLESPKPTQTGGN